VPHCACQYRGEEATRLSSLEVVATPSFGKTDLDWLMQLREARAHSSGPPHFTLVFPGSALEPHEFVREVIAAAAGATRIRFCLRSAIVVPDPQVSAYHVFLVPDAGFGSIVRLHDRLHATSLAPCLRPDVPYLPHVTVASAHDFAAARKIAASLNGKDLSIDGRIDELEVHRRDGDVVRCIARVKLAKGGLFG
jgi:2'-5' RNA ligase